MRQQPRKPIPVRLFSSNINFKGVYLQQNIITYPVTLQVVPRRKWSGRTNYRASSSPAGPCKVAADGLPCCRWSALLQMVPPKKSSLSASQSVLAQRLDQNALPSTEYES